VATKFEAASERTISVPFELRTEEKRADGSGLSMSGYAAMFNSPTEIDSWEGRFTESIARGAFVKSISERMPVLQFDHGAHPFVGSIPIGAITSLAEDSRGLRVEAQLFDNMLVKPVRDAISAGAIDGMSFRFQVVNETWDYDSGDIAVRTITELRCMELGPVVFPAYQDTSVSVRSAGLGSGFDELFASQEARSAFADWLAFGTKGEAVESDTSDVAAELRKMNPARLRLMQERAAKLEGK
tara:strand:- start:13626 stop:14351 length:726 start_codon:yes stop_codon:yes gene_type:complete